MPRTNFWLCLASVIYLGYKEGIFVGKVRAPPCEKKRHVSADVDKSSPALRLVRLTVQPYVYADLARPSFPLVSHEKTLESASKNIDVGATAGFFHTRIKK